MCTPTHKYTNKEQIFFFFVEKRGRKGIATLGNVKIKDGRKTQRGEVSAKIMAYLICVADIKDCASLTWELRHASELFLFCTSLCEN